MDRTELLDLLTALVAARRLTAAEAGAMLRLFDAGDLTADDLPLPLVEAGVRVDLGVLALSLSALAEALGFGRRGQTANLPALRLQIAAPYGTRRRRLSDVLDAFDREAVRRSGVLFAPPDDTAADRRSRGSLRRWHTAMKQAVAEDLAALAQYGAGRPLTASEIAAVQSAADREAGFLRRFAGEIAARDASGRPMSEKQVAARLRMYSGSGHALFYEIAETAEALGPGWVYAYEARDDAGTCSPCVESERGGPYLGGQGPMPGAVCRGRGLCRCVRVPVYDPAAYARLTGATGATGDGASLPIRAAVAA